MTFPSLRPPAIALALGAVALAAIITVVALFFLGLGPFAPSVPQPSSPPTAQPSSQPTIGPTTAQPTSSTAAPSTFPGSSPSASPPVSQPPATPSTATDVLLGHVPEPLRPSCAPASFEQPALALVTCSAEGGGIAVSYTLYADQPSMAAVYDAGVIGAGIDDNSGRCYNRNDAGEVMATTSRWPSDNGYTIQDQPVGRYLCHDDGSTGTLTWTDDRLYVLARASTEMANVDRLISFWIDEAGPVE